MRKFFPFLLLAGSLLLTACGQRDAQPPPDSSDVPSSSAVQAEASLPFTLAVYPEFSLHPTQAVNRANLTLAPLLYEPLFQVDEQFRAVPLLCQSYTVSEDSLTWVLTLRSGVTFSNGEPLTGAAVADALNLARGKGGRYESRLRNVVSVTGEEGAVRITLRQPNAQLPLLLDIPIALGQEDRPAGTGPYVLTELEEGLCLVARNDWWQGKELPVLSIPLKSVARSDELLLAFSSGELSLADVDLMGTNTLGYSGNYEILDYATTDLLYLGFNTQRTSVRSPQARLALSRAIDRSLIVQADFAGHAVAAALPVHPDSPLYSPSLAARLDYAPEELAEQAKALHLDRKTLTLLVNSENRAKVSAAQRVAYQLESAGVPVVVSSLPFADYSAALAGGDFDLYLGEVVLTADFDLSGLLSSAGALNYGKWYDDEISALLSAFAAGEGEARAAAGEALLDRLTAQVPILPLCFKNGSVLTQWGRLSGLTPLRGNIFWHFESWIIP